MGNTAQAESDALWQGELGADAERDPRAHCHPWGSQALTLLSLVFWSSKSSRSSSNFFSFASDVTFSSCSFCRAPSSASRWDSSSWSGEEDG